MHKLLEKIFPEPLKPYAGRIVLTVLGFVVAILFLTLGFWKTILIVTLSALGFLLGKLADGDFDASRLPVHPRLK